jgi:hypothetical protein
VTAAREAIYLPAIFLSVTLLGGMRIVADAVAVAPGAGRVSFNGPPLFALVLAMLLVGVLVRAGALVPGYLVNGARSALENLNGAAVVFTLFAATAQAFNLATPSSGLPLVLFDTFLLVLLINTLVAAPDAVRVLRSLMVIFGSAFVLKFVILAAISDPAAGRLNRVLQILLEGVTLGTLTQERLHPASGYIAFFTLLTYLIGLTLLPRGSTTKTTRLTKEISKGLPGSIRSRDQD